METAVRGRDDLFITPWRHQKLTGAITLDAGVHNADILQYYFGDATGAYGQTRLYEQTRVTPRHGRTRRLLREVGRQLAADGRGDRRGRDVRPDHLRQRRARAVGRPLRRPWRAVRATAWSSAPAARIAAPGRPQRPPDPPRPRRRHRRRDERSARLRAELPARARWRRPSSAASAPGRYDFDFADHRPQAHRAGVPRAGRVHPQLARRRRSTAPLAAARVALVYALFESQLAGRPVTIAESSPAPSTPTSARSTSTTAWSHSSAPRGWPATGRCYVEGYTAQRARGGMSVVLQHLGNADGPDRIAGGPLRGARLRRARADRHSRLDHRRRDARWRRTPPHPRALRRPRSRALRSLRQHAAT